MKAVVWKLRRIDKEAVLCNGTKVLKQGRAVTVYVKSKQYKIMKSVRTTHIKI
jgi:hypothetical protein